MLLVSHYYATRSAAQSVKQLVSHWGPKAPCLTCHSSTLPGPLRRLELWEWRWGGSGSAAPQGSIPGP